jgi:Chloramphenicol phosphotransferase-like protein
MKNRGDLGLRRSNEYLCIGRYKIALADHGPSSASRTFLGSPSRSVERCLACEADSVGTAEFWSAVDYPFHYEDSLSRCLDLVSEYTVLYVGVFCPIDVLEQREAARGDRKTGLARYQSARLHENSEYDVEVETHELSPNQAAQKIISALETIAPPTAFERLRSKVKTGAPPIASR